ncbi:hypothetical protein KUH32_16715 [Thalassococcus sp. CAU 1522]|uniref:Uncharacterized protein n=1 Tax=Thalassococcus arenae TaxID=2851652 RepID=A0ABS6NBK4_9RHOB|nr:hypothetical protein [Thalassococcus arenae]MBV2361409.1 hypothetical protein [Thalassococcus arenae]
MTAVRSIFHRFGRAVAFVGLGSWAVGTMATLALGADAVFQRFGALGVAASVLFFTDRLLKIELSRQRSVERLLHEYGVELAALRAGTAATDIPGEGYAVDFLTEERNFDALRQKADLLNIVNVGFLTLTTLQWGFGDYFLRWLTAAEVT